MRISNNLVHISTCARTLKTPRGLQQHCRRLSTSFTGESLVDCSSDRYEYSAPASPSNPEGLLKGSELAHRPIAETAQLPLVAVLARDLNEPVRTGGWSLGIKSLHSCEFANLLPLPFASPYANTPSASDKPPCLFISSVCCETRSTPSTRCESLTASLISTYLPLSHTTTRSTTVFKSPHRAPTLSISQLTIVSILTVRY